MAAVVAQLIEWSLLTQEGKEALIGRILFEKDSMELLAEMLHKSSLM